MYVTAASLFVVGFFAAAGCAGDGAGDGAGGDYPILPGTSGDPGGYAGSPVLRGRVCVATDLRNFGTCAETGAGGLAVSAGGASAITDDDGRFELSRDAVQGRDLDLMVTGPGVIPTFNSFSPSAAPVVTAIDADVYARELASNGVLLPEDTGAILGRVVGGMGPARGIGVTSAPTSPFGPFYDGTSGGADVFTRDRTGARGVFFVPGLAAGTAQLTFRDAAMSGETIVNGVMVRNGGITILDSVTLP
ncbi:MAG TPA: hypothetical protein VNO30_46180 [Kofleriaceae bacterium]|nr:hypothetical protein [Kofleriaceae bacterium]